MFPSPIRKVLLLLSPVFTGSTERLRILLEVTQLVSDRAPESMLLNKELCCRGEWDCEILLSQIKWLSSILGQVKFANLSLWKMGGEAGWAMLLSWPPSLWGGPGAIGGYGLLEVRKLDEWTKTFMFPESMMVPLTKTEWRRKRRWFVLWGVCWVVDKFNIGCDELESLWETQETKP